MKTIQQYLHIQIIMGCGSSVAQVSDSLKNGHLMSSFLLDNRTIHEQNLSKGIVYLFGQTKTQRKIIEINFNQMQIKALSTRTRIPIPKIEYDPLELMYEESQQLFSLGIYGFSSQPPFNNMLALFLQENVLFLCGGVDFDSYNVKSECFLYTLNDRQLKERGNNLAQFQTPTVKKSKYTKNKFQRLNSMRQGRHSHMGIIYIYKAICILAIGGIDQKGNYLQSCEKYSVFENIWTQIASLKYPRANGCCIEYGAKVYVFGGQQNATQNVRKIETYNEEENQWKVLDIQLHQGVRNSAIFRINQSQILIAGGATRSGYSKSVYKINLEKQTYIWDSQLNFQYQKIKYTIVDDRIIIFGGKEKNFIQIYDFETKQWQPKDFMMNKLIGQNQIVNFSFSKQNLNLKIEQKELSQQVGDTETNQIFFGNDKQVCIVEYNYQNQSFKLLEVPMPIKLKSEMGIVKIKQSEYFLCGGCDFTHIKSSKSCYYYNHQTKKSFQWIKMYDKRCSFGICYLNGYVYVFGGFCPEKRLYFENCQRFDINKQRWQPISKLSKGRIRCKAEAISNNKIAIYGGFNDELLNFIQIYSIQSNNMTLVQIDNFLSIFAMANKFNSNQIIAFGYHQKQKSFARYSYIIQQSLIRTQPGNEKRIEMGQMVQDNLQTIEQLKYQQQQEEGQSKIDNSMQKKQQNVIQQKFVLDTQKIKISNKIQKTQDNIDDSFELEKINLENTVRVQSFRNGFIVPNEAQISQAKSLELEQNQISKSLKRLQKQICQLWNKNQI